MYFKKWNEFLLEQITSQNGTNSEVKTNVNIKQLQEVLDKWNIEYSQVFKFNNDAPKQIKKENNITELLNNISPEYKIKVKESLTKLIDFFKSNELAKSFSGKKILIIGYTSTTASDTYNKALSLRRAKMVSNSLRSLMKDANINLNIQFTEEGMGESPDGLIILNDQNTEPIQLGKNAPQLSDQVMKLIQNDKEERQKLNRRVKITLPEFKFEEPVINNVIEDTKEEIIEVKKPTLPNPTDLTFNYDSYILSKKGQSILFNFCKDLKSFNESDKDKIKEIYISSHTLKAKEEENKFKKQDEIKRDKKLVIISCNRAKLVQDYIKSSLGEELSKNIKFYIYPVSYKMGEEKKVVINFEATNHMNTAKTEFDKLSKNYNLPENELGLNITTYLRNELLENQIFNNIEQDIKEKVNYEWIPLELFYDKLDNYYGLQKNSDIRNNFKDKLTKFIDKMNNKYNTEYKIEDFIYKQI